MVIKNIKEKIYLNSPWVLKNVMANFHSVNIQFKKYGAYYKKCIEELEKSQWYSTEELIQLQINKLKAIVNQAVNHSPYYIKLAKECNLSSDSIKTLDSLKQFPIINKDLVRDNFDAFTSNNNHRNVIKESTSGTSGKYMKFVLSKPMYQKHIAFVWHHRSWAKIKPGDSNAQFGPHRILHGKQNKKPFWIQCYPDNRIIFSTFHMTDENLWLYAQKLTQFQPKLIWGYPNAIYILAQFLENEKQFSVRPKAIFTSSETLYPYQREKIEKVFQTKVYNHYGNTERVSNIMECEKGNLHIRPEYGIIEFLDKNNQPVKSGQIGKMIATGLCNYAMPLIRYDIGDLAIPVSGECECGRKSPLIKEIVGRLDDVLITADGRYISRLGPIFHDMQNIVEAQIVQNVREKVSIRIVKKETYSEKDTKTILKKIRKIFGNKTRIEFEFLDKIPRLPSGKYKFVVSNLNTGNPGSTN